MRMKSLSVRRLISLLAASALVATLGVATLPAAVAAAGPGGTVIFDNTPATLPGNLSSLGFEATSTSEWGTQVSFDRTQRLLTKVVVTMSSWACESGSGPTCVTNPGATFNWPITFNIYDVGTSNAVGTLLASDTQTFAIPYRPSSAGCTDLTAWYDAADGGCYHGLATNITFDFSSQRKVLPSKVIFGVAFNTSDYGLVPQRGLATALPGAPYDSLNVAMNPGTGDGTVAVAPAVGTWLPDGLSAYLNSTYAGFYLDNGAGGLGTFRIDTGPVLSPAPNGYQPIGPYGGYEPAVQFSALPVCTPTYFYRDGYNLTAAVINPAATVTGTVDATGCNIGVYYHPGTSGTVSADISGANYYGVVADRAAVNVASANIHGIGETQPNGSQHGVGVLYTTYEATSTSNTGGTTDGAATGTLSRSTITAYQKNGVVIYGAGAAVTVQNNTVTGYGQINYIAQNGIEIAIGATASVTGNTVSNNYYTPTTYTACGLLFYQAGGVQQSKNVFSGNETNVCNAGRGGGNTRP